MCMYIWVDISYLIINFSDQVYDRIVMVEKIRKDAGSPSGPHRAVSQMNFSDHHDSIVNLI